MGKPKARNIKRKPKENTQDEFSSADQQMGDGDNSGKSNMDNQITKNKIVTEDIKISHTQTSKVMKKKDRRKQRKEKLLEKVKSSGSLKERSKKAKKRSQAVIVGDIQPLMDALPEIAAPIATAGNTTNQKATLKSKNWNDKKWKTKRKEELNDINLFKKVLQLSDYKKDPLGAISNHVEYMVKGDLV